MIMDEVGNAEDVKSAQTISQRGVSLVVTAHGSNFKSVLQNPVLNKLIGGLKPVIIGDDLALETAYGPH